jgi:hypothetical protein
MGGTKGSPQTRHETTPGGDKHFKQEIKARVRYSTSCFFFINKSCLFLGYSGTGEKNSFRPAYYKRCFTHSECLLKHFYAC